MVGEEYVGAMVAFLTNDLAVFRARHRLVVIAGRSVEPPPYFGRTEDELRECVTAVNEEIAEYSLSVNGQEVPDLDEYWTTSPLFTIIFPEDNFFDIEPGVANAMSEAISFIIAPPPPGEYVITGSLRHVWESVPTTFSTTIIVEAPQVIEPTTT